MSPPIVFRDTARIEFDDAAAWYEARVASLGVDFIAEIQKVLDTIADHPNRYPAVFGDVRAVLVRRFPDCLYYRVRHDRIVVMAVFHTSRDPSDWKLRS